MNPLPESSSLDISILSRLFDKTTNSYKYLFFFSILDILKRVNFDRSFSIQFDKLIVEMLANAWYPHTYFRLSFGKQDGIAQKLESLTLDISEPILKFTDTDKKILRKTIESQDIQDIIKLFVRYVPFRLLRPFFSMELAGIKDYEVNPRIVDLANREFNSRKPLYCFDSNNLRDVKGIIFHPEWIDYLQENYTIIRGWVAWEWLRYMQDRNQSTPNIVGKLFMPQNRGSLSFPLKHWKELIKRHEIHCIYSGELLAPDDISIDHFLPWSFVAHDLMWNLIPIKAEVNSSKSNNLPSLKYFEAFVALQYFSLQVSKEMMKANAWEKLTESYVADLALTPDELLERECLQKAYESTLKPLLSLASQQGFTPNWIYKNAE